MLKLKIVLSENYDEEKNEFVDETLDIELEHSLASLSKWEMIWEIPYLSNVDKTDEMYRSYIECMCLTPNIAPEVFRNLGADTQMKIAEYLDKENTAVYVRHNKQARSVETITAESFYFWMSSYNINWEAQYWPLNKLIALIQVFGDKQEDNTKKRRSRSRSEMENFMRINAQRRKELGTKG